MFTTPVRSPTGGRLKDIRPVAIHFMEINHPVSSLKSIGIEEVVFHQREREGFGEVLPYAYIFVHSV